MPYTARRSWVELWDFVRSRVDFLYLLDIPNLDSFGISQTRAFLSANPPSSAFRDIYYAKWDDLIAKLPNLISSHTIGQEVRRLPMLDTSKLSTELHLRRAYVVLAFLTHGYVWAAHRAIFGSLRQARHGTRVELRRALPVELGSKEQPEGDEDGFCELDRLESQASFTGTRGEDAFYHVPVLIEAEGGPLVSLLLDAVAASEKGDAVFITDALNRSAETFVRMGKHLPKMYSALYAHMFYHEWPFLSGGKGMEAKGLPRGMVFRRSDAAGRAATCIGGSAGQSSLFQFLDYVLASSTRGRLAAKSPSLRLPSLRAFVKQRQSNKDLAHAYESCMQQLRPWRDKHMAVVSKCIVRPARLAEQSTRNGHAEKLEVDAFEARKGEELQGTGGSALIPFLRQPRDETLGFGDGNGTAE
ncbi:Uncharacterized protein TPAR_02082 [Tolypocladium paradoxum]|uniref:Indoleamine 2,3-dioxygenase n=1 Tax=Tolypocladium paradoxum TaxID=94208 RepID=A0A2S4L5P2_9HYPO|nr:Uncharacterized protein TPAR_02082 [Tolypocladium paradoxum]